MDLASPIRVVGAGSNEVGFSHPEIGSLVIRTGLERVAWGYTLNTANFPTYAGEVVQILSCYVEDLEVTGVVQTYRDMETIYSYFLSYVQIATQGQSGGAAGTSAYNQVPMTFSYPHRGWEFTVMPKDIPGYRKGREVVVPEWRIQCHVADETGDVDALAALIIQEAEIKTNIGAGDDFDENFGLEGKIKFVDENPFSDPFTDRGTDFAANRSDAFNQIGDFYSKLLPSYLKGDFDSLTGGLGSKPAFNPDTAVAQASANDTDSDPNSGGTVTQQKKADKIGRG
jgi:hypothetical protein